MDNKVKPTIFNSGNREDIPTVDPDKRVASPEYTRPVTDSTSTLAEAGVVNDVIDPSKVTGGEVKLAAKPTAPEGVALTEPNTPAPVEEPGFIDKTKQILGGENSPLKKIKPSDVKATVDFSDGFKFDSPEALKRAGKRLGLSNDISNLSDVEANELMETGSEFLDILGYSDESDKLGLAAFVTEEGIDFANADASQAEGIFGLVNNLTGNEDLGTFFDLSEEIALIHALTDKAIEWGIPGYIDQLTGAMWDTRAAQLSIERNLSKAARMSDFVMFRKLWDKLHSDRRYACRERYLVELLQFFKVKEGVGSKVLGKDLMDITEMVYPKWHKDPYDPNEDYAYYFSYCSNDAVMVLATTDYKILAYIGQKVKPKSTTTLLSQTMPNYSSLS